MEDMEDMDDEDMEPENVRRSSVSQSGSVRAVDNIAPTAVSDLTAVDVPDDDGGRIMLSWTASASDRQVSRQVAGAVGPVVSDQAPGVVPDIASTASRPNPRSSSSRSGRSRPAIRPSSIRRRPTGSGSPTRWPLSTRTTRPPQRNSLPWPFATWLRTPTVGQSRACSALTKTVGFDDYFHFADHYGSSAADAQWEPAFDLASKDAVDADGLAVFARNFGRSTGAVGKASPPREGGQPRNPAGNSRAASRCRGSARSSCSPCT